MIIPANTDAEIALARSLIIEYANELGIDLSFQDFDQELTDFPGDYGSPRGRILLALQDREALGCVAIRPWSPTIAEVKRLYVRPDVRGKGIGRALTIEAMTAARALGYSRLRLDTLPTMQSAVALYKELGFREISPYRQNPISGTQFLEYAFTQGETDLEILLRSMAPTLREGEYVFCTIAHGSTIPGTEVICMFREDEGTTLVLRRAEADAAGLSYTSVFRWITLAVHSSLDAVGFLAAVTRTLAVNGISVNAMSAYYHDHLFVPSARAEEALTILHSCKHSS